MSAYIRAAVLLILSAAVIGVGITLVSLGIYGLTVFVVAPILCGVLAPAILRSKDSSEAAKHGASIVGFMCFGFLALGLEGLYCVLMTLPLALPLGALGGALGFRLLSLGRESSGAAMMVLLALASFTWDVTAEPPVYAVETAIEIAAPPEKVWKHVVAFPDLPEPNEWYFRAGIAYPKRARIEGAGTGAVRYCEFSTGPFVEPIQIWDEPRLLKFDVSENPAPMNEWSPYANVTPRHLHGYFTSKQGQFRLVRLAGNRTRLEGTTWYQHGLWPGEYWRWWSDAIIYRIHLRVLNHIRTLAE